MEVQRLCSVLDQHLEGKTYMVGEEYTLADIMCFPWFNMLRQVFPFGVQLYYLGVTDGEGPGAAKEQAFLTVVGSTVIDHKSVCVLFMLE